LALKVFSAASKCFDQLLQGVSTQDTRVSGVDMVDRQQNALTAAQRRQGTSTLELPPSITAQIVEIICEMLWPLAIILSLFAQAVVERWSEMMSSFLITCTIGLVLSHIHCLL